MKRLGLFALAAALVLGAAAQTFAQAPSAAPAASAAPRGPDRVRLERERDRVLQQLRERGVPLGSASGAWPLPSAPGSSSAGAADATAELGRRWRAFSESRLERRERHRAALVRQLGPQLSDPRVKDELKLHATRVAELARIRFLAENARTGAARDKLLARVVKLTAKEEQRHQAQLARLAAPAPVPSGSAAPTAPMPSGREAPR